MLSREPDSRPTVSDIICSKLLSDSLVEVPIQYGLQWDDISSVSCSKSSSSTVSSKAAVINSSLRSTEAEIMKGKNDVTEAIEGPFTNTQEDSGGDIVMDEDAKPQESPQDDASQEYDDDFECESDEEHSKSSSYEGLDPFVSPNVMPQSEGVEHSISSKSDSCNSKLAAECKLDTNAEKPQKINTSKTYAVKAASLRRFLVAQFDGQHNVLDKALGLIASSGAAELSAESLQKQVQDIAEKVKTNSQLFPLLQLLCFLESTLEKGSLEKGPGTTVVEEVTDDMIT